MPSSRLFARAESRGTEPVPARISPRFEALTYAEIESGGRTYCRTQRCTWLRQASRGLRPPSRCASPRRYDGLPDLKHPFQDRDIVVTACGRICMHKKKINVSTVLAGQKLGIKQVDDGIWLVALMHYGLGNIDLEQRTLQTIDNPFGTRLSPMS